MVKSQLIKINGVDVTSKRFKCEIEDTFEEISQAEISFSADVESLNVFKKMQSVTIWEAFSGTLEQNSNRKFKGHIAKIERTRTGVKILAYSELWKAIQTVINQTFDKDIDTEAGVGSEIFKTLCDLSGISYSAGSIVSTGSDVIDTFTCIDTEVYEKMEWLKDYYGYQIYYRPDTDLIYFEPKGQTTNSNVIYVGGANNNVVQIPQWKFDATKIFNKVTLKGGEDGSGNQIKVVRSDTLSIDILNRTIHSVYSFPEITNEEDAKTKALSLLNIYSNGFVSTKLKISPEVVESFNLKIGQQIRIVDSRQSIDANFTITKIKYLYPQAYVEVEVGDKETKVALYEYDTSTRLKRLEEESQSDVTILTEVKDQKKGLDVLKNTFNLDSYEYDSTSGYLILGMCPNQGYPGLGTAKLLGTGGSAYNSKVDEEDETYNEIGSGGGGLPLGVMDDVW